MLQAYPFNDSMQSKEKWQRKDENTIMILKLSVILNNNVYSVHCTCTPIRIKSATNCWLVFECSGENISSRPNKGS